MAMPSGKDPRRAIVHEWKGAARRCQWYGSVWEARRASARRERPLDRAHEPAVLEVAARVLGVRARVVLAAAVDPADQSVAVDQERDRGEAALGIALEPVALERGPAL